MQAIIFVNTQPIAMLEVRDRFDFEDTVLHRLVPARPCETYRTHEASPRGIRVFNRPGSAAFEARPYLEFGQHVENRTRYHVMQEGRPTGLEVVLR